MLKHPSQPLVALSRPQFTTGYDYLSLMSAECNSVYNNVVLLYSNRKFTIEVHVRVNYDYTRIAMNSLWLPYDCIQSIHRESTLILFRIFVDMWNIEIEEFYLENIFLTKNLSYLVLSCTFEYKLTADLIKRWYWYLTYIKNMKTIGNTR